MRTVQGIIVVWSFATRIHTRIIVRNSGHLLNFILLLNYYSNSLRSYGLKFECWRILIFIRDTYALSAALRCSSFVVLCSRSRCIVALSLQPQSLALQPQSLVCSYHR